MLCIELPILLMLAVLAVYALAILLRVSCYFCNVEIPALGRAYFTAGASVGLSLALGLLIQFVIAGPSRRGSSVPLQFLALLVILAANMVVSTALYAPLLELRLGQAFSVWLVQAVAFLAFAVVLGCCLGLLSLM